MKKIVIGFLAFFLTMPLCAQSEKASIINNIKKENNLYLYGDVTLSSQEVAYEVALQELQSNLAEWASNHSRKAVERTQITDLSLLADTIVMKRYNMYRVFAYVHKAKVMEVLNKNGFKIHDNLVTKDDPYNKNNLNHQGNLALQSDITKVVPPTAPSSSVSTPTDSTMTTKVVPKTTKTNPEKPSDTPSGPEVTPQVPKSESKTPAPSNGLKEIFPNSKKSDAGKQEKDAKKDAAPESSDDKLKKWKEDVTKSPIKIPPTDKESEPLIDTYQNELERILKARDFFDLEGIMTPMKKSGKITEMGRYTSGTDVSDCYLVVYDTDGNIRALLSPGKDSRMNIGTRMVDYTSNYKNCGAIWFKLK